MRDYVFDHSGPVQSNRCLALVNRVLNFALEEDLIEANPAARMRKAGKEKPRERVLSDNEIAKLWRALADAESWTAAAGSGAMGRPLSLPIVRAIRVLLLTGQRRAEVVEAPIGELALWDRQPVWTIASQRVKTDVPHRVPLATLAAFEFRRAIADANAAVPANSTGALLVFPSPNNWREPVGPAAVTKAMHRLCKRIGIDRAGPHDLRRTVGTGLAKLGVPPDIRSLVLNHTRGRSTSETTRVYDRHGYDNAKLEALAKWENHVSSIVSGRIECDNDTIARLDFAK
ncbi:MAG: tyrosine-type recombinase/integrase [Hyphomicrobium aestuarii]|nr:tyrosine-type recombinase/integrase [Hyphomicrobium aestuarii]